MTRYNWSNRDWQMGRRRGEHESNDNYISRRFLKNICSWELGVRTQALLELNAPHYSVNAVNQSLPPSASIPLNISSPVDIVLGIAKTVVSNRTVSNTNGANYNYSGPQLLTNDSSTADPASLGTAVLLANWTGQGQKDGLNYAGAATDQLNYLFDIAPRTSDGAISHRIDQVQLWSDYVYMVPPFLAYYGVLTNNGSILYEAYNQVSLYRSYLMDQRANGLWRHILLGSGGDDDGHWSTGNAWAAAGMVRVLGTIYNSPFNASMVNQTNDLVNWIGEIHQGMYTNLDSNFVFKNYPDEALSATNFYDASSTALMASTVYRLSTLANVHTYIPYAEKTRKVISENAGSFPAQRRGHFEVIQQPRPMTTTNSSATTRPVSSSTSGVATAPPATATVIITSPVINGTTYEIATATTYCPVSPYTNASSNATSPPSTFGTMLPPGCTTISPNTTTITHTLSTPSNTAPLTTPTPDSAGSLQHFTHNGWLEPVVNPYNYTLLGSDSPEAQAFVVLMQAAWRDWVSTGSIGQVNASTNKSAGFLHVPLFTTGVGVILGLLVHWTL